MKPSLTPKAALDKREAEQARASRKAAIQAELDELDRKSIRALRATKAGIGKPDDDKTLADIESKVAVLRTELSGL